MLLKVGSKTKLWIKTFPNFVEVPISDPNFVAWVHLQDIELCLITLQLDYLAPCALLSLRPAVTEVSLARRMTVAGSGLRGKGRSN